MAIIKGIEINLGMFAMFEVSSCNQSTGVVTVEDIEFGLKYEFNCEDVKSAKIQDDYDLHITKNNGTSKIIRILE
jgi:hypothetical protein